MATERDIMRAAYHEAGQCVMAYTVGQDLEDLTLLPHEGHSYRWQAQDHSDPLQEMQVMMVLAAGPLSERLATEPSAVRNSRPQSDDPALASLATAHATREISANTIVERVFTRAADLLNDPRRLDAIHSLASALMAQQSVGAEEAADTIRASGVRKSLSNLFAARQIFAR